MILRALHTSGFLDISSQEFLQGETVVFRYTMKPGQVIDVPDEYRTLKNIDSAIRSGLLELVSYNKRATSIVMQEELDGLGAELPVSTVTVNNGETKTLDSVSVSTSRAAKWFVNIIDNTNSTVHSVEVYAQYNGSTVDYNVSSKLGSAAASLFVDFSGGDMRLQVTASADNQAVASTRITVANY